MVLLQRGLPLDQLAVSGSVSVVTSEVTARRDAGCWPVEKMASTAVGSLATSGGGEVGADQLEGAVALLV